MQDSTLNGVPFKVVFPRKKSKFQFVFGDFIMKRALGMKKFWDDFLS